MSQLKRIKRLIYFTYLICATALLIMAGAGYGSFRSLLEKDYWVDHTRQVIYHAERAISFLKDAQVGQRGYIITGDSVYLVPYLIARDSISRQVNQLQRLTADNPTQQVRIDTLKSIVGEHMVLLARTIRLRTADTETARAEHFAMRQGKANMDQLRHVIGAFTDEENQLLTFRSRKLAAAVGQAKMAGLAVLGLAFLFAIVLFVLLRGQLRQKENYELALQEKNVELGTLNGELAVTNQELAASNEELAASNEELAASNEEVLSGNEELGALNESLEEHRSRLLTLANDLEQRVQLRTVELQQANEELRRGQLEFTFLTEFIPQLVWRTSPEGKVEYFNQRWYQYTGQAPEEALIDGWGRVLHPEDLERTLLTWQESIRTGNPYRIEYRLRKTDGTFRWFLGTALPQRGESGTILNWYGSCTEIHEQKMADRALQESEDLFHTLASASPVTLWMSDETGGISYVNQTWLDWTGRPFKEQLGAGWSLSILEEDRQVAVQKYLEDFSNSRYYQVEFRIRHHNGRVRWCIAEGAPRYKGTGEFVGYVGSCIDITDRKQAEQDQQRTLDELTRLNVDLDNFVYTASHDLRSPIANLEGLLLVLKKRLENKLEASEREMMGLMEQSVGRLKKAIKELSEIAKIQKETQQPREELSIRQVLREVSQDIAALISESSAQVVLDMHVETIHYPAKHLRSILYNLLSNALKYRCPSRKPVITITTRSQGDGVHLTVNDNGLGLTESQVSKLFFMFKRLHTHVEGTGVGLYMVKRIVENYGGRIWVESKPDVGTTFHLYFTASPVVQVAKAAVSS
jgi:PAS domain S-box-containing protein